ncbi:glutamate receptor ionotropic, kainate 2-like [Hyalella azteca]|uniref:Glutamate receptor ionotropic, kainate 2-like n=1 Tax=Hyalella azteca TaxID=294128 RepID=A0A8B7NAR9_HYAAZ|nr:glutamate receptor ionotropic, kainate 2-like [Hyalella azteca]
MTDQSLLSAVKSGRSRHYPTLHTSPLPGVQHATTPRYTPLPSQAYRSVLQALGWQDLVVVCDSSEGLLRVKELLKDDAFRVTLRDLPRGLDYRELLKAIKLSGIVHILLEVHRSKIHSLLKQAQQIGLMTAYHHYFITSLVST